MGIQCKKEQHQVLEKLDFDRRYGEKCFAHTRKSYLKYFFLFQACFAKAEYGVSCTMCADRRWVSETSQQSAQCWKRKLSLIRCTGYRVSCFAIQLTSSSLFLSKCKRNKKKFRNYQHPRHMLIQFNVYWTCIIVATMENQLKKIYWQKCLDFDFAAIAMNFPSKNVFIISRFVRFIHGR